MRFLHKLYAKFFGYFWLPCPLCGRYFGGHEWKYTFMLNLGEGKGICNNPECIKKAKKNNDKILEKNKIVLIKGKNEINKTMAERNL